MSAFERELARFIEDHRLPDAYIDVASTHYLPLIDWLLDRMDQSGSSPFVVGIYGAQGSGKSTLADLLFRYLTRAAGKSVLKLSIDDFYLTRQERAQLAADISPLLATRGPPGTHDIALAIATVEQAVSLADGASMTIPRFDKATDDRVPESDHEIISGPIDLVILEGWCLGCKPVDPQQLAEPINALERNEDNDGSWRRYVNASIHAYQPLFELIDGLVMLKTADFSSILHWRNDQEEKLRAAARASGDRIMTAAELERFVQLFERVSRSAEARLDRLADVVFTLDAGHGIQTVDYRQRNGEISRR